MMNSSSPGTSFDSLPVLSDDERDDAGFRGNDLAWSCLAGYYDDLAETDQSLSYQRLGLRIGRTRAQVQRWIDSPHNMTLKSLSLLAEGLDADLQISLISRVCDPLKNACHPAEEARAYYPVSTFERNFRSWAAHLDPAGQGLLNGKTLDSHYVNLAGNAERVRLNENALANREPSIALNTRKPQATEEATDA